MASVRYEWIRLGRAIGTTGWADNVITDTVGAGATMAVTTTATAANNRPAAPASGKVGELYARLTAIDGCRGWSATPASSRYISCRAVANSGAGCV
ncbi:hypothetical protein G6L16_008850 [Agrobacterium tumefaciens]|uniref:hypothetical protein n=1 Tax=Agrobacterium tumefaciens TaxID=358 RepID=UPI0015740967|nr:hypothetical protein [Agrobacterium tumefaciens]NSZ63446.1 hypothetical protein [Agrobacterium tumefaciens]NTA69816.1 hypothetical protein [Agrobacterium tumefaciens]WIE36962.1 hypothetical protein G6L16_008850 [Agrobacterium tumefaciens]